MSGLQAAPEVDRVARVPRLSWLLLTVTCLAAAGSALWVAVTPADDQTELGDRTWQDIVQRDPEVASLYSMDLVVLGLLGTGFGLLAAAVSGIPYQRGERWAWSGLWLVPITIGAVAARMLVDRYATGYYYAGLTAVAVVCLLLPVRDFWRRQT